VEAKVGHALLQNRKKNTAGSKSASLPDFRTNNALSVVIGTGFDYRCYNW
jgi:hypothetical protein